MYQILTILFIVVLDQVTKHLSRILLSPLPSGSIPVFQGIFHFTYVRNPGAAFGILQNKKWFFIVLTIIVAAAIGYYLLTHTHESFLLKTALCMILGGALGNLIDRIRYGYVIDFLDFRVIHYPVFNIADCAVVLGTILLGIYLLTANGPSRADDYDII